MNKLLNYMKGHIALVGVTATFFVAAFPDTQAAKIGAGIIAALTVAGVYGVRNRRTTTSPRKGKK